MSWAGLREATKQATRAVKNAAKAREMALTNVPLDAAEYVSAMGEIHRALDAFHATVTPELVTALLDEIDAGRALAAETDELLHDDRRWPPVKDALERWAAARVLVDSLTEDKP